MDRTIPRTMSTQHPDNVNIPPWCRVEVMAGDDEVQEAYHAFRNLGCHEVMWDSEGKDADLHVVRKLLAAHSDYFRNKTLGCDLYLTYRVPNPRVETSERKVFTETLENLAVCFDVAHTFHGLDVPPVFEVILPFTTESQELLWVLNYYRKVIVDSGDVAIAGGVKVRDWIGEVNPKEINVIPLIEDYESLLRTDRILEGYIEAVGPRYVRAFIARSDPALNYGLPVAVLLSKIALSKMRRVQNDTGIPICPIVGVGSLPFRGHLSPANVEHFKEEFAGVYTVTIQSSYRYDHPQNDVQRTIKLLNETLPHGELPTVDADDEKLLTSAMQKLTAAYQKRVESLGPLINYAASFVPARRARKLHIGLFGYSRSVGKVVLPRAIPFVAAMYSLGVPPEFLGLEAVNNMTKEEETAVKTHYKNLRRDLEAVAGFVSWENINMLTTMRDELESKLGVCLLTKDAWPMILSDLEAVENHFNIKLGSKSLTQRKHDNAVNSFLISLLEKDDEEARKYLVEAARIRKSLG
ncbi:MAG: phosphoenolpyruvate carboxylase [Candidatus Bathyarchaeia archaeon]